MDEVFNLDWGVITPDLYDKLKNRVVHVFNFELRIPEKRYRAIKFAIGRIVWFNKHLPDNVVHNVVFDVRGQGIKAEELKTINQIIHKEIEFLNDRIIIEIEFKE